jgi:PhnB protein
VHIQETAMQLQPYLHFDGRCDEAIEFYRAALGAELTLRLSFRDSPVPMDPGVVPPGAEDKVMHAQMQIGDTVLMLSDGRCGGDADFKGFSLALRLADEAAAQRVFAALAQGGDIRMPLGKTFFSPCFGMVADRFGVSWMVLAGP